MDEKFLRRVENVGFERGRPSSPKRSKGASFRRKKRTRLRLKERDPVMTEILRPFAQGRRQVALLGDRQLMPLSSREYREYLATPHWQQFVRSYRQDEGLLQECFVCGNPNFDIHHRSYSRLGSEDVDDVVPLCREHHEQVHRVVRAGVALRNAHVYVRARHESG